MAGYIIRGEEKSVVLSAKQADMLIDTRNGEAALLFLLLQRLNRGASPEELRQRLGFSALQLAAAERALQEAGLLSAPKAPPIAPSDDHPQYSADELSDMLETDRTFSVLVSQVEQVLGKRMKTADLQLLAGLYDDMGLPADVIYLLVCHCTERTTRRFGEGRRPTMRQIEKEGCLWARMGISDQESADRYLRSLAQKQEKAAAYLRVLNIHDRPPVDSELHYLQQWWEQGFSPETVALAYDKTVFHKKEMNWRYLNGILRRWHENGWHTVEEVKSGEQRTAPRSHPSAKKPEAQSQRDGADWMLRYMKK
ncbi:MAG: DnaD domain protein [Oscillospiraceae bacterium]|nr:DnaD domain protein [Oscillospiraceae bacterium]